MHNNKWKFKSSGDYYTDLAMKESTNKPGKINDFRYIGLYQFGEATLADLGYYKKTLKPGQDPSTLYRGNDWSGTWTGKNGINSREDFLNNRLVQEIAVRNYHKIIWKRYLKDYQKYENQEIGGVLLTRAGMISAAHLVGHGAVKEFINSGGKVNKADGLAQTCVSYLSGFGQYSVDYSTTALKNQLSQFKSKPVEPVEEEKKQSSFEGNKSKSEGDKLSLMFEQMQLYKAANVESEEMKIFKYILQDLLKDDAADFRAVLEKIYNLEKAKFNTSKEQILEKVRKKFTQVMLQSCKKAEAKCNKMIEKYTHNSNENLLQQVKSLENEANSQIDALREKLQAQADAVLQQRVAAANADRLIASYSLQPYFYSSIEKCITNADIVAQKEAELDEFKNKLEKEIDEKIQNLKESLKNQAEKFVDNKKQELNQFVQNIAADTKVAQEKFIPLVKKAMEEDLASNQFDQQLAGACDNLQSQIDSYLN